VTSKEALVDSASRLAQSHAHVIGAVLNAVSEEGGYYYGGYRRYAYRYRYSDQDDSETKAAGTAGRRKGWRKRAS
jgi:Mrp family chromosome partitioning ATPase